MARTSKKYPREVQEEARRLARGGRSTRQISRQIHVPYRVVKGWTAAEREARQCDRVLRLSKLGRNAREIAVRLDLKIAEVEKHLSRSSRRPRSIEQDRGARRGTETRRAVRRMADRKDPVTHIAEVLGLTPKTVRAWLREAEEEEEVELLPGARLRTHDREAILADVHALDEEGSPRYTRAEIRQKYGCSHKFLSLLANGRLEA